MKKVLKLFATCVDEGGKPVVKLNFQTYKDNKPSFGAHVIIYKREEKDYVFDYDEGEYFDTLMPREEDIIFDGDIEIQNTFSEFSDYDVEIGKVYVYWVGREGFGKYITGPVPVKVRDTEVYYRYSRVTEEIVRLSQDFPQLTVERMGKTVLGKPLDALFVGNSENRIACIGTIHAGESGPEILLTALRELLTESPELFERTGVALLPTVNADMRERMSVGVPWYLRTNLVGVDINRNFDADWERVDNSYELSSADYRSPTYRGPYPNSEPETEAVISFIDKAKPSAVFSYHALASVTADEMLSTKLAADDKQYLERLDSVVKLYSDAFREGISEKPRECARAVLGCSPGSLPNYVYKHYGVPAFDLEMASDLPALRERCITDRTTPAELSVAIKGHKSALKKILEEFGKTRRILG